ncbi:uncharacterized protein RSE6_06565 [Rhynchosporium secalis]|uniref:Uncharacterized protein n=1 Tax=Rhynchosporium secalis TaxID=38038 RepID=A0A1E1MAP0_RHYSE|nr:uncharacterized protein RSE6_06565 [Rhynchosporium secalis]
MVASHEEAPDLWNGMFWKLTRSRTLSGLLRQGLGQHAAKQNHFSTTFFAFTRILEARWVECWPVMTAEYSAVLVPVPVPVPERTTGSPMIRVEPQIIPCTEVTCTTDICILPTVPKNFSTQLRAWRQSNGLSPSKRCRRLQPQLISAEIYSVQQGGAGIQIPATLVSYSALWIHYPHARSMGPVTLP